MLDKSNSFKFISFSMVDLSNGYFFVSPITIAPTILLFFINIFL
jgi:hypothetical protein